jgi:hypothetical protein
MILYLGDCIYNTPVVDTCSQRGSAALDNNDVYHNLSYLGSKKLLNIYKKT